jgi:hypothetical protein
VTAVLMFLLGLAVGVVFTAVWQWTFDLLERRPH